MGSPALFRGHADCGALHTTFGGVAYPRWIANALEGNYLLVLDRRLFRYSVESRGFGKGGEEGEDHERRVSELKEDVKMMLENMEDSLSKLELVDTIERLGLEYNEIRRILESIYNKYKVDQWRDKDLYGTALGFRLFRQRGYRAPEEALKTGTHQNLVTLVNHALDQPLHWRVPRLEARWFIDAYKKRLDANPTLLELAKLDFNMVQATYQEDLKHMSSWWKTTGLAENLSFARDRLMENFVWTVGYSYKPEFGYSRRISTKVNALITTIDDVYDVYGTLEELELFTSVIDRLAQVFFLFRHICYCHLDVGI
ncbi:hypothetical protein RJ640_000383 [Escallonia rubra]|uniref:Uncharacterized protein n=1 Tax=Escallonia rubra TaxID=112253 RepID=A0AA88RQV3_9ASTE|nr:hypothetical protein RJ640_000383 [Escallonia rubra]